MSCDVGVIDLIFSTSSAWSIRSFRAFPYYEINKIIE